MSIKVNNHISWSHRPPPVSWQLTYEPILYHSRDYLQVQEQMPGLSYWLLEEPKELVCGELHLHMRDKSAVSHLFAPFGSLLSGDVEAPVLKEFLTHIEDTLLEQGVKNLTWYHYPPFYGGHANWISVLQDHGYQTTELINHHIPIDEVPFQMKIHSMELRKLNKCRKLIFQCESPASLSEIYHFIADCRRQRGQQLSLSYQNLSRVLTALPDDFLLCTVRDRGVIAAATVVIKVNAKYWYNFYPAHHHNYNAISPMVFLLSGLYRLAANNGVQALDLGTSQVKDLPLNGLMEFKSHVGGIETKKPSFYKNLA